jgi:DNA-binding GntR family transcriptional regulator
MQMRSTASQRQTERRSTLVQEVVHRLEREISKGRFQPGDRLDEQKLAAAFGVSRTPVREALRHLAAAGLIDLQPRRGASVAQVPLPRMIQMLEVMSTIEGLCARLAARRMSDDERQHLRRLVAGSGKVMHGEADVDVFHDIGLQFHDAIYAGTHNPFLEDLAKTIRNRVAGYRRRQLSRPGRMQEAHEEHLCIVEAIAAGDADAAEAQMVRHISMQSDRFIDFISALTRAELLAEAVQPHFPQPPTTPPT